MQFALDALIQAGLNGHSFTDVKKYLARKNLAFYRFIGDFPEGLYG